MSRSSSTLPLVSVAIRSFHRPEALKELLERPRKQRYPHFEIVVYEQSDNAELVAELNALGDARLKVCPGPALSPPAARNAALRNCCGEILLFIDDDDLPVGDDWIARLMWPGSMRADPDELDLEHVGGRCEWSLVGNDLSDLEPTVDMSAEDSRHAVQCTALEDGQCALTCLLGRLQHDQDITLSGVLGEHRKTA